MSKKKTVLCILDGFGIRDDEKGNAIRMANTPNLDKIFSEYKMVRGNASSTFVGLPEGQMGNSEVGHLNIGAGRVVYQDLMRIFHYIDDGEFFTKPELLQVIDAVKKNNSTLHLMGLLSDGGVHSHIKHLFALLKFAKMQNIEKVVVHCFLDGRDTAYNSAKDFILKLEDEMKKVGVGKIGTIVGRYYAMDRDKNYDRIELAYNMLIKGIGKRYDNATLAIDASYKGGVYDEFVKPKVIYKVGEEPALIKDNDGIVFINFRPDRARQITRAFVDEDFNYFKREKLKNIAFAGMTEYDVTIKNQIVVFKKTKIKNHLGNVVADNGLMQLRTAETEKYAHVTFFFNGGVEEPCVNEDRWLVPSPKEVATYDLKPEMSAYKVCDNVLKALSDKYDFIVVNFANPDMVGHTGKLEATIKAIEVVDECVGKIFDKVLSIDANMMIIADHGNADKMLDEKGSPCTTHTTSQVPFCLITKEKYRLKEGGSLCDIAPTLLEVMGLKKPEEMLGKSLIYR